MGFPLFERGRQRCDPSSDDRRQIVKVSVVEPGHRDVERIRLDDDVAQCAQSQPAERFASRIGDRPHLSLRVRTRTFDADLLDQFLSGQPLDRSVQAADRDVGPQRHVLLFGQKPKLMAVHRATLLQGSEEKDPD